MANTFESTEVSASIRYGRPIFCKGLMATCTSAVLAPMRSIYVEKPPMSMMIMPRCAARLENARLMDWMISSHGEPVLVLAGRISPRPDRLRGILFQHETCYPYYYHEGNKQA